MALYRIVEGNDVELHVVVRKRDVSRDYERLVDYDLRGAEELQAVLVGGYDTVAVSAEVKGAWGNEVVCHLPEYLEPDVYDLRLSWRMDGRYMQSVERRVVQVVTHNGQTRVPMGLLEGEPGGLLDLRFYLVTANQSQCVVRFMLDNVTCDKEDMTMKNGETLEAALTGLLGYSVGRVAVVMNGVDITDEAYDAESGRVTIAAVSGWVTVTAKGRLSEAYTGASAATDVAALDLDSLTKGGAVKGRTVTVVTTDDEPVVWIVTRERVSFMQGGLEAAMHSQRVGDLWYYWSDELTAGENVYEVVAFRG